jgi:hypothetical protein
VDDALLMRGFEGLGDLLRDGQRFAEGDRSTRDALRQIVTLDEFHDQRTDTVGFFDAVDGSDVRMAQ